MELDPHRPDALFWAGVDEGRLLIQRCGSCAALRHPPLPMCPECQSLDTEAAPMSGRGHVYSWIVSRHPNQADGPSRIIAVVQLDEGPRVVADVREVEESAMANDIAVEVFFDDVDGVRLHQFRPCHEVSR